MPQRSRKHSILLYLNEEEKYILDAKYKLSGMRSRMTFLRHLILYGYVYDIDYKELHEYNTNLARIGNNLNQITKRMNTTNHLYEEDIKEVKELKITTASWKMVYAENDAAFDALWDQMIADCEGLDAQSIIDWRLADLENAKSIRDSLK